MPSKRKAAVSAGHSRKKVRTNTDSTSSKSTTSVASDRPKRSSTRHGNASGGSKIETKPPQNTPSNAATRAALQDLDQNPESKICDSKSAKIKDVPQEQKRKDDTENPFDGETASAGKNYWLMKAEPEDRFENGYNVKFSIDDLRAATKPEPWDGVRNYVARNNMIAMQQDDLAFFYHSNCAVPGIVGIMKIVEEHTVDESAFDSKHPYYDAKSQREKPRWELVHVGFVKKFKEKISLKQIQQNAASTKELEDMDLLKYKRLSVTRVKAEEWDYIIAWAGDSDEFKSSSS